MTGDSAALADLDAEVQVLGALMLNPRDRPALLDQLDADDWWWGRHRTIHEAVVRLDAAGHPVNALTVSDDLATRGQVDDVGGAVAVMEIADAAVGRGGNGGYFAVRVAALARRRRIATAARRLVAAAEDVAVDVEQDLAGHLDDLAAQRPGDGLIQPDSLAEPLSALHRDGRRSRGRGTGWPSLDEVWRPTPGTLLVITGWPGSGKSAWLDAVLANTAALHDWRWAVWSAESGGPVEHTARHVGLWAGRRFEDVDVAALDDLRGRVDRHLVFVDADTHRTVPAILARAAAVHARAPLAGLVIDPWTQLDPRRDPQHQREDEWINVELGRLKRFAVRHQLVVAVVVHPRQDRNRGGDQVVGADQLGGGAMWRRHADHMLSIHRDVTGESRPVDHVDVHVQKIRRNGIDGHMGRSAVLRFDAASGLYHDDVHPVAVALRHPPPPPPGTPRQWTGGPL